MPEQSRGTLKGYYVTGAKPSESNFVDFLDSVVLMTTGTTDNEPVPLTSITEQGTTGVTINTIMTVHDDVVGINKATPTANSLHIDNGSSETTAVVIDVAAGSSMSALEISGAVTGNLNAITLTNTGANSSDNARIRIDSTNGDAYYSCLGGGSTKVSFGYRNSSNAFQMAETWGFDPFLSYSRADNALGFFTAAPDANTTVTFDGTKPIKLPQITTAQRDAVTPDNGMMCFNTTTGTVQYYDGTWNSL